MYIGEDKNRCRLKKSVFGFLLLDYSIDLFFIKLPMIFSINNYNHISTFYPFLEKLAFGSTLQTFRHLIVKSIRFKKKILIIGEGNGHLLKIIMNDLRNINITIVENSSSMCMKVNKFQHNKHGNEIKILNAGIEEYKNFFIHDCIVTSFFWDNFESSEIRRYFPTFSNGISSDCIWINVDFHDHAYPSSPSEILNHLLIRFLYLFFGLTTDIKAKRIFPMKNLALENGFSLIKEAHQSFPFIVFEYFAKDNFSSTISINPIES